MSAMEGIFKDCRTLAEKMGNDFVSEHHFMFVYNNFRDQKNPDFKVSLSDKKEIVKVLKKLGRRTPIQNIEEELFPVSIILESALKDGKFHKMVFGDKTLLPKHIFISLLILNGLDKEGYKETLEQFHIRINKFKNVLIDLSFNPFLQRIKLFRWFF